MNRCNTRMAVMGFVLIGCNTGAAPPMVLAPPLTQAARLVVSQPTAESHVMVEAATQQTTTELTLSLRDLQLVLRTGAHARLETLELPLGDAMIPAAALPPDGVTLRDLKLGIDDAVELDVPVAEADHLELHAESPLRLTWSLQLSDGSVHPLGAAVTAPMSLDFTVDRAAGATTATLFARCPGTCWAMDGLAQLDDGQLLVEGAVAQENP